MAKRPVVSDEEEAVRMKNNDREVIDAEVTDDDEAEEEEEEEGQDEYEKDGFVVDDVEEQEEQEDEEEKQKKKRKKRESGKNYVLDEDDYELLEDNNVLGFRRPKMGSKKFKRLKRSGRDTEQGELSVFSDDEGPHTKDVAQEERRSNEGNEDSGEDDEMADFIVDEEEYNENVSFMRRRKLKKKKPRQLFGVSSSALEDAHDIFGDVDELLRIRKQGFAQSGGSADSRERRLEDEFEPSILEEKYLTEKDDHIRGIDVPERIQVSEESTGPPPVDEISVREECSWILSQLATNMTSLFCWKRATGGTDEGSDLSDKINEEDILRFLNLLHVEKCDVPFIAMYRKEHCLSLLKDPDLDGADNEYKDTAERTQRLKWHRLLWAIKDLDRKWLLLQKRKSTLQLYYNKRHEEESCGIIDGARLTLNQLLFESITKSLKNGESEREVDDVDLKFNLHFPLGDVARDEGKFKRPKRRSPYTICSKAGLWKVAGKLGCNSEQLGMLIDLEEVRMSMSALEDSKETPEATASNFTCTMFETPQAVLKGARHMAAVEISYEPRIRKHVRSIFMEKALVSTSPTSRGNLAMDSFHPFAAVKFLRDKPLCRFEDAQWLLSQKAEEERLLQISFKLPEDHLTNLISKFNEYYLSDGVSKCAQLWNEQRKLILQDAIFNFLLPSMEKDARTLLTTRAKNWLLVEYGKQFWNKISVAPYHCKDGGPHDETPRVMACCWGPGNPATTFVMLDSSGEVLDVLYAGSLSLRSQNEIDQQRKKNDQQCVLKFMIDHQPHVVVLGAVNLSCTRLKEDIYEIIYKMVEETPRDIGQAMDGISIVYGDESLPHLYEHSRISSNQLPGKPGIVKRAVALGRYLQNPLAMVATLCGSGREIVSWKLGSLEHFLTPDEKYDMIEQLMVDVTNQVGTDINLAAGHDWLSAPLQFVSGLGPRKAAFLQRSLVRAGAVPNRRELTGLGLRTKKVFINAIGFLCVRCNGMMDTGSDIDLLDGTRIHPESYGLAKDLAKAVYTHYVQDCSNSASVQVAIEYVRDNPELLKGLDIDQYAKDYEEEKKENKRETLYEIKMELLHGFKDCRKPYQELSQDETFYMISGENGDTLAEGRIVHARVRRVRPQQVICVLDSGLTGILSKDDISDQIDDIDLTNKLHEGDILACKIKHIRQSRYQVILSYKESDLKGNQHQNCGDVDPFYSEDQRNLLSKQEKTWKEEFVKKNFKPRMIVHPCFQNLTLDEVVEFLSDKDAGESIIRPSSRGPSYLTLTLKIYDGVYAHKEIIEGGKDNKDVTSFLFLGKTLKIGDDSFEDLDEVMDRYVDPLVTRLKAMLSYRKFRTGSKGEVDELLRIEKSDYPKRIVYCFGISYEHPGAFILSYIRSTNPHHEYIGLHPKGFKFRKHTFDHIDRLVEYFQKHIDELQHDLTPSFHSVSAMLPKGSTASGGLSVGAFMAGSRESNYTSLRGQSNLDRNRSSTPFSRDRNDYKMGGGGDAHPSGLLSPDSGCGRDTYSGSGNRRSNERRDSAYITTSKWGLDYKDGSGGEDRWSNFPGGKVQNTPGREAFPGGWGSSGSVGAAGANWVGGNNTSGWGGSSRNHSGDWGGSSGGQSTSGNWGDRRGGGSRTGNFWGGSNGHNRVGNSNTGNWGGGRSSGCFRGGINERGCGRGYGGRDTGNKEALTGVWDSNISGSVSGRNWGSKGSSGGWGANSVGENGSGGNWDGGWGSKNVKDSKSGVVIKDSWGGNGSGGPVGGSVWAAGGGNDDKGSDGWGDKSSAGGGGQSATGRNWGDRKGGGSRTGNFWGGSNGHNQVGSSNTGNWGGGRSSGYFRGGINEGGRGRSYGGRDTGNKEALTGVWGSNKSGSVSGRNWGTKGSSGGWGANSVGENGSGGNWDGGWGSKNVKDSKSGVVIKDSWGGSGSGGPVGGSVWAAGGGNDDKGNDGWGDKSSAGGGGQSATGRNWGGVHIDGWGSSGSSGAAGGRCWAAGSANDGKGSGGWGDKSTACREAKSSTGGNWGRVTNDSGSDSAAGGTGWATGGGGCHGKWSGGWGEKNSAGWAAGGSVSGNDGWGGKGAGNSGWAAGGDNDKNSSDGWGNKSSAGWGAQGAARGNEGWARIGTAGLCGSGLAAAGSNDGKRSGGWGNKSNAIGGAESVIRGTDGWGGGESGSGSAAGGIGWAAGGGNDGKGSGGWGNKSNAIRGAASANSGTDGWGGSGSASASASAAGSSGWAAGGSNDGKGSDGWGN